MYGWNVRERNVRMKGKRKEMYGWKVRERNVCMKSKRKKCMDEK